MTNAAGLRAHAELASFYARPAVRWRIGEFFGIRHEAEPPSALTPAGYGGGRWLAHPAVTAWDAVPALFEAGADILRSRADREGTLLVLDVAYVHPADPFEPQREPARCYERLEPVHRTVLATLARFGVEPLVLMTLAGYQYLARAPLGSRFHAGLVEAGGAPPWARPAHGSTRIEMQQADRGAMRLVELVAHRVLHDAAGSTGVPVRLADVPPPGGAPFVRIDIDGYADDPEHHHLRCAFSGDQRALITRPGAAAPFVVALPCGSRPYRDLLGARTDLEQAAREAESSGAAVPDVADAEGWLRQYDGSALACFHREMDHALVPTEWTCRPAGLLDTESLPPCVGDVLRRPSPALLQPRHLRTVALGLWSLGWHPRAIAALVGARYDEPHDWGTYWEHHDPASRAEFFVRLFCASAAGGLEDGGGVSCADVAHHGACPGDGCGYDLGLLFGRRRRQQVRNESHA